MLDDLQSAPDFTPETRRVLTEQKELLNSILKNRAQGALIRSRFKHATEIDKSSSYLFNLEKSRSRSKTISRIRLDSGEITENIPSIKTHAHKFYKKLYSKISTDEGARENILRDLSRLDHLEAEDLERPLSLDKLDAAVGQLGKDKSPAWTACQANSIKHFGPSSNMTFFPLSIILFLPAPFPFLSGGLL